MTLLAAWMQRPFLGVSRVATVSTPLVTHVHVHGKLSSEIGSALQDASTESRANGLVMVVHLNAVRQVTAAGLGILMSVRRQMLEAGLTLSLAGLSFKHRFLLHAWCAQPLFDEWESTIASGRSMANELEANAGLHLQGEHEALPAQTRARS
jgi:anti-anti-sigma regulatory factor